MAKSEREIRTKFEREKRMRERRIREDESERVRRENKGLFGE